MNNKTIKLLLLQMLTTQQKDLTFGTLLGDGNLQTENQGRTWRYRAIHSTRQISYLDHKYEILKDLCRSGPAYLETFDDRTKRVYKRYTFNTVKTPSLNFYANMFYTKDPITGKYVKDVPVLLEKFLTPRALAYFYMDAGALKWLGKSNGMRLCTENFSLTGVQRIQKALKNLYDVNTTLSKKGLADGTVGFRITIPEGSSSTFREVIRPHLVESMKYKVSDGLKEPL